MKCCKPMVYTSFPFQLHICLAHCFGVCEALHQYSWGFLISGKFTAHIFCPSSLCLAFTQPNAFTPVSCPVQTVFQTQRNSSEYQGVEVLCLRTSVSMVVEDEQSILYCVESRFSFDSTNTSRFFTSPVWLKVCCSQKSDGIVCLQ